ncbi:hypothetical protein L6452_22971 [Arctium lappa]|uniref:Uncharacterized protein n=1 Tax=Arctium lappa TaxID=4217 RepID=A0ACB9B1C6_ARCLA|nr:hypothetical protein L6452_22971 [Arctium lappa]
MHSRLIIYEVVCDSSLHDYMCLELNRWRRLKQKLICAARTQPWVAGNRNGSCGGMNPRRQKAEPCPGDGSWRWSRWRRSGRRGEACGSSSWHASRMESILPLFAGFE